MGQSRRPKKSPTFPQNAAKNQCQASSMLSATAKDVIENKVHSVKSQAVHESVHFIHGLEHILRQRVEAASALGKSQQTNAFHTQAPSVSIKAYLNRMKQYFACSDECFIVAFAYIERLAMVDAMAVCDRSVHRLVFFAMLLAAKFHDDRSYGNGYYARVGGVSLAEVNALEVEFLKLLDWKMCVDPKEYQRCHALVCEATGCQTLQLTTKGEPEPEP